MIKLKDIKTTPKKGRPRIEDRANTIEAQKPWLEIRDAITGKPLSRRAWYQRRKEKEQGK